MSKKKLTLGDFKRDGRQGSFGHLWSYKNDKVEICLESCMNGYDVALYDLNQELLKPKICTDVDMSLRMVAPGFSMQTGGAIEKALEIANKLIKEK